LGTAHGWEFLAFGFPPLRAEQDRWHHLPRVVIDGGVILTGERWTLDESIVARLASCRGAARYALWRREAERMELPPLVHMRAGAIEPELLLATESPLAIECMFDAIGGRSCQLVFTELPGDPKSWPLIDGRGQHYLSEIAVTWCADSYWAALSGGRIPS
jgi:hypothetical protein